MPVSEELLTALVFWRCDDDGNCTQLCPAWSGSHNVGYCEITGERTPEGGTVCRVYRMMVALGAWDGSQGLRGLQPECFHARPARCHACEKPLLPADVRPWYDDGLGSVYVCWTCERACEEESRRTDRGYRSTRDRAIFETVKRACAEKKEKGE